MKGPQQYGTHPQYQQFPQGQPQQQHQQQGVARFIIGAAVCLLLTNLPFIIGDLYYGYNEPRCANTPISNTSISFPISTWLRVDGYILLALSISLLLIGIAVCMNDRNLPLLYCYAIISLLAGLFRIAWLIVGAIMFWGYLLPNNSCSNGLNVYMWILLIIGFLSTLINCLSSRQASSHDVGASSGAHRTI